WRWCARWAAATRPQPTSRRTTMSKMESDQIEAALGEQAHLDRRRKKLFLALGAVLIVGGAAFGAYDVLYASRYISTDNAYTAAETAQVTPSVSGIVREVRVVDTQPVHRGDIVAVLDDVDARLALEQADADLGRAVRRVR